MTSRLVAIALTTALGVTQSPPAFDATPGEFVWHDLVTDNPAVSRAFYGSLFGWRFTNADGIDPGYTVITHNDRMIGGIVKRRSSPADAGAAQWLAYVMVSDIDRATAAFVKSGGKVFRGPLAARKDLRVAAVADAQGAAIGLANRGPRAAPPSEAGLNDWLWMEYVARDPEGALAFYADAIGYRHDMSENTEGFVYHIFSTDRPRAGLFKSLWERETSAWLPYIRVADPAAMAAQVEKLGGKVLLPPRPRVRNNSLAIVLDPSGAPLALQKYPFDNGKGGTP